MIATRFVLSGMVFFASVFSIPSVLADPPASALPKGDQLLTRTAEKISYNPNYKQADWVSYSLSPAHLQNCFRRNGTFHADDSLSTDEAATLADYKGSGFDRGHLMPAGDAHWNANAMKESFALSNVAPQPPKYNQGIWAKLENLIRAWGSESKETWVMTGPQLNSVDGSIGDGKVGTARAFYKAIVSHSSSGEVHGIAFLLPVDAAGDLSAYSTSISHLEEITGLSFYTEMDAAERRKVADESNSEAWDFSAKFSYFPCATSWVDDTLRSRDFLGALTRPLIQ